MLSCITSFVIMQEFQNTRLSHMGFTFQNPYALDLGFTKEFELSKNTPKPNFTLKPINFTLYIH